MANRLQLLKEVVPRLTHVAVLWNAANPATAHSWEQAQDAARTLGLTLQSQEVRSPTNFDRVFSAIARDHSDAPLLVKSLARALAHEVDSPRPLGTTVTASHELRSR